MKCPQITTLALMAVLPGATCLAGELNLRDYIIAAGGGGSYTQTGNEPWTFLRGGYDGELLDADTVDTSGDVAGGWNSPSLPFKIPVAGYLTNAGNADGLAVTPSFDGVFVHPGAGISSTIVYTAQSGDAIQGITFNGEMPFNGALGNGIAINVGVLQGGVLSSVDANIFTAPAPLQNWSLDLSAFNIQAGERIVFDFSDNGSDAVDQGNINLQIVVPTPSSAACLILAGLCSIRRRRRCPRLGRE